MIDNQVSADCQQVGPDSADNALTLVRRRVASALITYVDLKEGAQISGHIFYARLADAAIAAHLEALIEMELPGYIREKSAIALIKSRDNYQEAFRAILKVLLSQHKHKGESQ